MAISAALPRPGVHPWPMDTIPDPEVRERPVRRRFAAAYKLAVLDELDHATAPGAKGAISSAIPPMPSLSSWPPDPTSSGAGTSPSCGTRPSGRPISCT